MGAGSWSASSYNATKAYNSSHGIDSFAYSSSTMSSTPRSSWKAHETLDPKNVKFRESRDSDEHPNSTPIAVLFDVTGSMGSVPRTMQDKLGSLHGLISRGGYAEDPQILFGGIGDADSDLVPLQVGQFESDNRMDENLGNILLEGGGGGQKSESYELAAYFMLNHTVTDSWEKRGEKGYLFIVGDELNKPRLSAQAVLSVIGDTVSEIPSVKSIYEQLQEKWHVFYILPNLTAYYNDPQIINHWKDVLGPEQVLMLDDPEGVCELIAVTIGLFEDSVDLGEALDDLVQIGSSSAEAVGKALSVVGARGTVSKNALPDPDGVDDLA